MKRTNLKFRTTLFAFIVNVVAFSVFAESGIYVGGHFRRNRPTTITTLKASGFTYVILFNVNVEANGDLTTDGETICSNGVYVFGSKQPNYVADVMSLKTGKTSVTRVEMCVGGWGNHSYTNIKALVNSKNANGGTGVNSILYKNFKALKEAIPCIDAFNNDDEEAYDVNSGKAFHVMLYDLGMKTSLAPYMNKSYWTSLATGINTMRKGAVDRIYLQCYDGGASNQPSAWGINGITMHSGLTNYGQDAAAATTQMTTWKGNSATVGGFLWVYNDETWNLKTYASAINKVFGGGEVIARDSMPASVTVYPGSGFQGKPVTLDMGKHIKAELVYQGMTDKSISSVKTAPGFKMDLYKSADCTGAAFSISQDTPDLTAMNINDSISSINVRANGDGNLNLQKVYIKNRKNGLFLTLASASTAAGITIQQKAYTGTTAQQWQLGHVSDGGYRVTNALSSKVIQVKGLSLENNAVMEQAVYTNVNQQKFVFYKNEGYYKLISFLNAKCLMPNPSTQDTPDTDIVQAEVSANTETDWEIISTTSSISQNQLSDIHVYPSQVTDFLYLENRGMSIKNIELLNLKGLKTTIADNQLKKIDVSHLEAGLYFLRVTAEKLAPQTFKFIKL